PSAAKFSQALVTAEVTIKRSWKVPWFCCTLRGYTLRNVAMSAIQTEPKTTTAPAKPQAGKYKGKSGAQIIHEMLVNDHKVDTMFGYPGGAILPMFDQLYKTPAKFILNRHEQSSGHC